MANRVAFFLPHFGHGGAEGVVLRLLGGLDRARFAPVLILQRRRGELLERVPADVPVLALARPRPPACIRDLAAIYGREGIALAVTLTNAANLYSVLAARMSPARPATLVTDHTPLRAFLQDAKLRRLRSAAIRRVYPHATLTGAPLPEIGAELSDFLGAAAPPFVTLPNPVVEGVRPSRALADQACEIISVGRLAPEKRFDLLIDAFAMVRSARPDARLTIYGEGAERPVLEARIAALGLGDSVRLPGFVSDLDGIYAGADLFVCTSRREGLGNAIIEAMAGGVPVVSVDCPFGPRWLLRDGAAGRLVTRADAPGIAEAMAETLADRGRREAYVAAGIETARGYEIGAAIGAYEAAFDRAIAAR